jgi:hypothetical protein
MVELREHWRQACAQGQALLVAGETCRSLNHADVTWSCHLRSNMLQQKMLCRLHSVDQQAMLWYTIPFEA